MENYPCKELSSDRVASLLPKLRGALRCDEAMKAHLWFRTGGCADWFFIAEDYDDLQYFLQNKPKDMPYLVIGIGSNMLVRDGGLRGSVIKLGKGFEQLSYDDGVITAGAAVLDFRLAKFAQTQGRAGLEFYAGIPGSVGGAVKMNAGAYESDTSAMLLDADIMHEDGQSERLTSEALGFSYRHSQLTPNSIVLQARFQTQAGDKEQIAKKITEIQHRRKETQPIGMRTGGSTFKNPKNANPSEDAKAWQLIDSVGMRGACKGDAQISEKHCNFLINRKNATATELEELGELARKKVHERHGIWLEWEIIRIGEKNNDTASERTL